ncbi:DNA cytosine methyltransferase [Kitasatospora purpeofusca]|uniref:DNA cytosine methyltransferase n=1 Tax=Kitasatospora purpeofusca TaxID=67352 RepID=UPI002E1006DD|nr:DNA cytosine methyltransferase [Kitasatospora purpeofusca]WSR41932.1 DNA cytosine methyltransferase [Kitasatospora purpeofusca]
MSRRWTGRTFRGSGSSQPVSPVKDVSVAGRRVGLNSQTRSGLWLHVARAVEVLRPCLLVVENVRGLLTSPGSAGDLEPCPWCLGNDATIPPLRALGAVLGTLAQLRYDARWLVLRASDVGAPHHRARVFLTAWPADHGAEDADQQHRQERRQPAPGQAQERRPRPELGRRGGVASADAEGQRRDQGVAEPAARERGPDPSFGSRLFAADTEGLRHGHPGAAAWEGLATAAVGGGPAALGEPAVGADHGRWGQYASAIARWETLTRPAPPATDEGGRLRAEFVEWMQGLPAGWVTATPGLGRPAQLTALGNGVVPQQAARALELLVPPMSHCPMCRVR